METLLLHHNCIRTIPQDLVCLQSLTYVDLSRNQLSNVPPCLFRLPLQVLLLQHNKLQEIPIQIGQLKHSLMELDLSCNGLTGLPSSVGELKYLRVLSVRFNLLTQLPSSFQCFDLITLDLSHNLITHLPHQLRMMTSLVHLIVNDNPLITPPAKLCSRGAVHTLKWLEQDLLQNSRRKAVDMDWAYNIRSSSLNRGSAGFAENCQKRFDKRKERGARYNTVGGDSGLGASIYGDNRNRLSQDLSSNGSSDGSTRRSPIGEEAPPPHPSCSDALPELNVKSDNTMIRGLISPGGDGSLLEEVMSACRIINSTPSPNRNRGSPTSGSPTPKATPMQMTGMYRPYSSKAPPLASENGKKEKLYQHEIYSLANGQNGESKKNDEMPCPAPIVENPKIEILNSENGHYSAEITLACGSSATPPRTTMKSADIQKIYTNKAEILDKDSPCCSTKSGGAAIENHEIVVSQDINLNGGIKSLVTNGANKPSTTSKSSLNGSLSKSNSQTSLNSTTSSVIKKASNGINSMGNKSNTSKQVISKFTNIGTTNRPMKAPPEPPKKADPAKSAMPVVFKSIEKNKMKTRDSLLTNHSTALRTKSQSPVSIASSTSNSSLSNGVNKLSAADSIRKSLGARLGVCLPERDEDLMQVLSDGVYLCNFVNNLRPRSIPSVHAPSPTLPVLSPAKCRRNVENFLMACRRLGVPENVLDSCASLIHQNPLPAPEVCLLLSGLVQTIGLQSQLCNQSEVLDKKESRAVAKCLVGLLKVTNKNPKMSISSHSAKISHV